MARLKGSKNKSVRPDKGKKRGKRGKKVVTPVLEVQERLIGGEVNEIIKSIPTVQ